MNVINTMPLDATILRAEILRHLKYSLGKDESHASLYDWRMSLSLALRDLVVNPWFESTRTTYEAKGKRVYYLSMEFLIGRLIEDVAVNLRVDEFAEEAMQSLGQNYKSVVADEPDAALGNGGLGRLAACFLDSLSTLGIPAYGYGIRYEHGLFEQHFEDGRQIETAEGWLAQRHAWEFERPEVSYPIGYSGTVSESDGQVVWTPGETVLVRCELDALPIHEMSVVPHRSTVAGKGHLCGHVGHMVTVLALGRLLSRQRPARGSSPSATGLVQGAQPMLG